MANAGTLLSDLDSKAPIAGDSDLVKMIYSDMNSGSAPPMGGIQNGPQNPMPPPPSDIWRFRENVTEFRSRISIGWKLGCCWFV